MTFSSCRPDFKFPALRSDSCVPREKIELASHLNGLAVSTPRMATEDSDYFAAKVQPQPPVLSPTLCALPARHPAATSSISSLASDATLVDGHSSDFMDMGHSTDTLVSEVATASPKTRRNVLLLRLLMPGRHAAKLTSGSLASARPNDSFPKIDEELPTQLSQSAVDPRFAFNRSFTESGFPTKPALHKSTTSMPLDVMTEVPGLTLRKQNTLPSILPQQGVSFNAIKIEQAKRSLYVPSVENMRSAILGLSPNISYLPASEIASIIGSNTIDPITNLNSLLIMDVRSFADFAKGNVASSLNVCPPLTLLRRPTFTLTKCVNSLPTYERLLFLNYLHFNTKNVTLNTEFNNSQRGLHGLPPIFVYDNNNYSANVYHMCKKLVDHSCWGAKSDPPIYLLDGPFLDLSLKYGPLITSGKSETIDVSTLEISCLLEPATKSEGDDISIRLDTSFRLRTTECSHSTAAIPSFNIDNTTPSVSNFSLPQNLPQCAFKIRHNEEVLGFDLNLKVDSVVSQISSAELERLPKWLKDTVSSSDHIKDGFKKLEMSEKVRLNNALSLEGKPELVTPGGSMEVSPVINCGLDYGHKNRYKDIFLYDHSRVKLQADSIYDDQLDCDYINASYLEPGAEFVGLMLGDEASKTQLVRDLKAIATQGPLDETIGDFWKCVIDQKCLLVISLTEEFEGGFHKCSAYWKPGVYKSGSSEVMVNLSKEETAGKFLIRSFTVATDGKQSHVLQIQLNKWQDMSVSVNPLDILCIVSLKQFILDQVKPKSGYSTISHCSAGCGRTGVFCAVDSMIGLLKHNDNQCELPYDPVYELVNGLRRQRILMVQTLRQYGLVYDVLVQYALEREFESMENLEIVKDFIREKKMENA